jgi:hypothetical protein
MGLVRKESQIIYVSHLSFSDLTQTVGFCAKNMPSFCSGELGVKDRSRL